MPLLFKAHTLTLFTKKKFLIFLIAFSPGITGPLYGQSLKVNQLQPLSGSAGLSFSIYGFGFAPEIDGNTVELMQIGGGDTVFAEVTRASLTKLQVTIPEEIEGGNYTIRVTRNTDSTTATSIEIFSVSASALIESGITVFQKNAIPITVNYVRDVYPADINGDGYMDILYSDNNVAWMKNNGDGSFENKIIFNEGYEGYEVYAIDLDGDGDMDNLTANFRQDKIKWYENNGDGTYTMHILDSGAKWATSVHSADLDGDGHLDVISGSVLGYLAWYKNNGDQTFTMHKISESAVETVFPADIDGDGDLDIIIARNEGVDKGLIRVYRNNKGRFSLETIANGYDIKAVFAIDIDNDGDIDILSGDRNKIFWLENIDGVGNTFVQHNVMNVSGVRDVHAADLDGDGDIDLLSASEGDDKIIWFQNHGSQNFTAHILSSFKDANSVFATDIDGDGKLDVVAGGWFEKNITWFKNMGNLPLPSPDLNGKSLSFNDSRLEALHKNIYNDLEALTLEAWVKTNSTKLNGVIEKWYSNTGFWFRIDADNQIEFLVQPTGGSGSKIARSAEGIIETGSWHHIAGVYDGIDSRVYLDGIDVTDNLSSTLNGSIKNNLRNIGIGHLNWSSSGAFDGIIDEVRIWNRALTTEEIQNNMFQQLEGNESGLIAYYSLDGEQPEGSYLVDKTGNNNLIATTSNFSQSEEAHPYGTFIRGSEGWRMLSSPAESATYAELLENLWTQGIEHSDAPMAEDANIFSWNETEQKFQKVADLSDAPAAGSGFIVYVFDDSDYDGEPDGFPKQIRVEQAQNSGLIAPALTHSTESESDSAGWNLVGNPYGATIDWNAASGWTKTNIDESFYIWNDADNAYQSHNGLTGTLPSSLIAPWQGFWVKANSANPSLAITDDARSAGGIFYKQAQKPVPQLHFKMSGKNVSSQIVLMFSDQASLQKDHLDAYKLAPLNADYLSLFTILEDGAALDINALPLDLEEPLEVALDFAGTQLSGKFELSWQTEALPDGWKFKLRNNATGEETDLLSASDLTFEVQSGAASKIHPSTRAESPLELAKPRVIRAAEAKHKAAETAGFTLIILSGKAVSTEPGQTPVTFELAQNYPNPFNPVTNIEFGIPKTSQVTLEVYDMIGRKVATLINRENKQAGRYTVAFSVDNLASGMYIYRLEAAGKVLTNKMTLIK